MRNVVLKTAYHWHCEDCGAENFVLPQKAELTDHQAEEAYRIFNGLDEWEHLPKDWREFELVQIPKEVTCTTCGMSFGTLDERIEPEEE